eukprot:g44851.t1
MTGFLSLASLLPFPQLQKELQDKNAELETLLQRRDRENEEGGNLVAMLRSDLERLTSERKNLEHSHEQLLKLFAEVVRVIFASEDMISRQIGLFLDGSKLDHGGMVSKSALEAGGQPPWMKAKPLLEHDKGDLSISQESVTITEDNSFWSALTDERLELSQWLSESMFTGPDMGPENEELILSTCVRLQVAVGKLLELITESTRQHAVLDAVGVGVRGLSPTRGRQQQQPEQWHHRCTPPPTMWNLDKGFTKIQINNIYCSAIINLF